MGKKLKITEEQLKKIIARRINENDYQDYLDTNYSSDGTSDYHSEQEDLRMADALYQIGKLFHQIGRKEESEKYRQEAMGKGSFHTDNDSFGPYDNSSNNEDEYGNSKDMGDSDNLDSFVGEKWEDDEMMNESIKKIKSEFQRYL